jgi:hypothetical protein
MFDFSTFYFQIFDFYWNCVPGESGNYVINRNGFVVSLNKRKPLKLINVRIDRAGYKSLRLTNRGISKTILLHRLIADAFVLNPENKSIVNHINGIKTDNRIKNLEWVTHSENVQHAYDTGLNNACKKIIDKSTGKIFNSISHASRELKINYSTCRAYLSGVIKNNKTCLEYIK